MLVLWESIVIKISPIMTVGKDIHNMAPVNCDFMMDVVREDCVIELTHYVKALEK